MRFHEIQSGEIHIDGVPTRQMTRENVHDQFCMVLQDTWLFDGTVREKLVYSTPDVPDEKIKEACKAVGLHYFIKTLSKGYDTVLTDQVDLSQVRKQQITITRAMIADKPMHGRPSFVIAHRPSTIKNSALILVMKDGDIIESGTHDDLLENGGFYAELYNSQFEQAS